MPKSSNIPSTFVVCLFGLVACGSAEDGTAQSVSALTPSPNTITWTVSALDDIFHSFSERSIEQPFPLPPGDLSWPDYWSSANTQLTYTFDTRALDSAGNGGPATLVIKAQFPLNGTDTSECTIQMATFRSNPAGFAPFTPSYWDQASRIDLTPNGRLTQGGNKALSNCVMASEDPRGGSGFARLYTLDDAIWIGCGFGLDGKPAKPSSTCTGHVVLSWRRTSKTKANAFDFYREFLTIH
jgi:hypothetical protein